MNLGDSTGLLPCPFCGGEALEIEHPAHKHVIATFMPDHPGSWTIECVKCSVGMIANERADVRGAWNQRTGNSELERLREYEAKVQEAEGRVCPEDVGFEEYIRHLLAKLALAAEDAAGCDALLRAGERDSARLDYLEKYSVIAKPEQPIRDAIDDAYEDWRAEQGGIGAARDGTDI